MISAFLLAFAAFLLPFGKLGDLYGRRLMFVVGISVFTLASLAAALAPSIQVLITARVAQGMGAAMAEPAVLAIIKAPFPPQRLGLPFGVQGIAAVLAVVIGPTLGGVLTTALSWEYIFLINLPVGVVAVTAALRIVRESRSPDMSRRLDVRGLVLSGTGIAALAFAIVEGPRYGWGSPSILAAFAAAPALLAAFVATQLRAREPLLDPALFRDRQFAVGNGLRAAIQFITLGVYFPLALFLQTQLGYSALQTGLALLPLVIASLVTSPLSGAASDRIDVRWLATPGFLLAAGGLFWLAHLSADTGWTFLLGPLAVAGLGLGALEAPTTSVTLRNVPPAKSGIAPSVSYVAVLLGAELGVAVVGAVLQSRFVANVTEALSGADVPPAVAERITSTLSEGGIQLGGRAAPAGGGELGGIIATAFAHAVNATFLTCVAVAALGALAAVFFTQREHHQAHSSNHEGRRLP